MPRDRLGCSRYTPHHSALGGIDPANAVVRMIESIPRAKRIAYHTRKLVLVYAVMRHCIDDLRFAGWTVDSYAEHEDFARVTARRTYA